MKKIIIAIAGESGTGKTYVAEYLRETMGISMVESYTNRAKRTADEVGHTFLNNTEYEALSDDEKIAETIFGENKYCCLESDLTSINTYVISENSIVHINDKFSDEYVIITIRLKRNDNMRISDIGIDRASRDNGNYFLKDNYYDYVIDTGISRTDVLRLMIDDVFMDIALKINQKYRSTVLLDLFYNNKD